MPVVLALLLMASAIDGARASTPQECLQCERAVTIQIHDYARVPADALGRARDIVSRVYASIGVRTEWLGVVRPREKRAKVDRETGSVAIGQMTLIILTPEMAARGRIAENILGFAAVPDEGMGRIAYVIYDRVRQTAAWASANEVDLLGFVMAHEIGHLLLPRGTRSNDGPMKAHLERRDIQQMDVRKIEFSAIEAEQIRRLIDDNQTMISASAARSEP